MEKYHGMKQFKINNIVFDNNDVNVNNVVYDFWLNLNKPDVIL